MRGKQLAVPMLLLAAACSPSGAGSADELAARSLPEMIRVESPAFPEAGVVPVRHTCDGPDVSPSLAWSGVPAGAVELAVVVDDPDAPRGTYVHWVVFGLDPQSGGLEEGVLPAGARQALGSGGAGYRGPCPPGGSEHTYRFSVYALGARLGLPEGSGTAEALVAIGEAAVAVGRLTGRYGRG